MKTKLNIIQQKEILDIDAQIAVLREDKNRIKPGPQKLILSSDFKFKRPQVHMSMDNASTILSPGPNSEGIGILTLTTEKLNAPSKEYSVFQFEDKNEEMTKGFSIIEKCGITQFNDYEEMYSTAVYLVKEKLISTLSLKDSSVLTVILGFHLSEKYSVEHDKEQVIYCFLLKKLVDKYSLSRTDIYSRLLGTTIVLC